MNYKNEILSIYPLINDITIDNLENNLNNRNNLKYKIFEDIDKYLENKDFIKYIIDKKIKNIKKILQLVFIKFFHINKQNQNEFEYESYLAKIRDNILTKNEDYFLIILLQKIIFNFIIEVVDTELTSKDNLLIYLLEKCVPFNEKSNLKILNNLTIPFKIMDKKNFYVKNKNGNLRQIYYLKDNKGRSRRFFNVNIFENICSNIQNLIFSNISNKIKKSSNIYNNTKNFHSNLGRLFEEFSKLK